MVPSVEQKEEKGAVALGDRSRAVLIDREHVLIAPLPDGLSDALAQKEGSIFPGRKITERVNSVICGQETVVVGNDVCIGLCGTATKNHESPPGRGRWSCRAGLKSSCAFSNSVSTKWSFKWR